MSEQNKDLSEVAETISNLEKNVEKSQGLPRRTFTYEEAAKSLGISVQTLSRLVACGAVSPVTIGKRKFISRRELDRIEAEGAPLEEQPRAKSRKPKALVMSEAQKVLAALKKH